MFAKEFSGNISQRQYHIIQDIKPIERVFGEGNLLFSLKKINQLMYLLLNDTPQRSNI